MDMGLHAKPQETRTRTVIARMAEKDSKPRIESNSCRIYQSDWQNRSSQRRSARPVTPVSSCKASFCQLQL